LGVDLARIVVWKESDLKGLGGKLLALDGHNALYQFLAIIRDSRGRPLRDRNGRVTSHLSGLLYRNVNLLETGIELAFVFDGRPPLLKGRELARRRRVREESGKKYEKALAEGRFADARRAASAAASLEDYMLEDAKRLLGLMGIPFIVAPSEGEAQASHMAARGDVWAVGSQDYDSFLFGSPRTVRNITLTGRRVYPSKGISLRLRPEVVELKDVLKRNGISREQLVDVGILVGTDFNDGIKGVGPVKALRYIVRHGRIEKIPGMRQKIDMEKVAEIREIFLHPEVTDRYSVEASELDAEGVVDFLCGKRDFSEKRVRKALEKIQMGGAAEGLDQWLS